MATVKSYLNMMNGAGILSPSALRMINLDKRYICSDCSIDTGSL